MSAAHLKLDNFCAILDYNQLQVDGHNDEVMTVRPIDKKFESFGWDVLSIDGHDIEAILNALTQARQTRGKPCIIIANTTKGKGVSFMEGRPEWHASGLTQEQTQQALVDIDGVTS